MPPRFRRRTTKKEPRRPPRPAALEERIEEIMDRVHQADDNQVDLVAALEEYLHPGARPRRRDVVRCRGLERGPCRQLSRAGLGRRRGRAISDATRSGCAEGAEMPCELAEKLMRPGHEPQAMPLWQQARADHPGDVWIYVQAGIGYGDIGDHTGTLEWLTAGLELALRTGDPESALEQLRPLRASCLSALARPSDEMQQRAAQGEQGNTGER
jgi:hypothetical protein